MPKRGSVNKLAKTKKAAGKKKPAKKTVVDMPTPAMVKAMQGVFGRRGGK